LEVERFAPPNGLRLKARPSMPSSRSCVCRTEANTRERGAPGRPSTQCAPNHISRRRNSQFANAFNIFASRASPTPNRLIPRLLSCQL
jgi:hypothetical protein